MRRFHAYGDGRGGKVYRARLEAEKVKRRFEVYWCDEAAHVDPWKPLTPKETLSDIKKLGEVWYGVQEEVCKVYERMKGEK